MKFIHYSGRHDRSPESLQSALAALMGNGKGPGAPNVITLTEVARPDRQAVLRSFTDWTVIQAGIMGANECAIMFRNDAFTLQTESDIRWHVSKTQFKDGSGRTHNGWWANSCILVDRNGEKTLVSVAHTPAHLIAGKRNRSHKLGCDLWASHVKHYGKVNEVDRIIVAADWNKDLRSKSTQRYILHRFQNMEIVESGVPTHDKRVIDGLVTQGFEKVTASTLPKRPASDHRPVWFILRRVTVYPPPYQLTTHDGETVDQFTHYALLAAEAKLGYQLTITQGSYNKGGVLASAGTHDGGGVVDLAPFDWENKVRVMSDIGFDAWHRLPSEGPWPEHIHCVLRGNLKASASAKEQMIQWEEGLNGLANHATDPNTHHPSNIFQYPPRGGVLS